MVRRRRRRGRDQRSRNAAVALAASLSKTTGIAFAPAAAKGSGVFATAFPAGGPTALGSVCELPQLESLELSRGGLGQLFHKFDPSRELIMGELLFDVIFEFLFHLSIR